MLTCAFWGLRHDDRFAAIDVFKGAQKFFVLELDVLGCHRQVANRVTRSRWAHGSLKQASLREGLLRAIW